MEEFLVNSARHAWPFYLGAGVVAILLLQIRERLGMRAVVLVSFVLLLVLTVVSFFGGHSGWARENRPVLLTVVNLVSILAPIVAILPFLWLLPQVRSVPVRYAALIAAVLIIMFFWPLWALAVTCWSGLDCL